VTTEGALASLYADGRPGAFWASVFVGASGLLLFVARALSTSGFDTPSSLRLGLGGAGVTADNPGGGIEATGGTPLGGTPIFPPDWMVASKDTICEKI
jgi:hypothetical protein